MVPFKDWALKYLGLGWTPIPLVPKTKDPLVEWKSFQKQRPSVDQVKKWWLHNRHANIAIITGQISKIIVFDEDGPEAGKFIDQQGGLPITPRSRTARGNHHILQYPSFTVSNSANKKLLLDVKGDGGYIVVPPSIHPSGHQYEWVEGFSPFEVEPAELRPWMVQYLKDHSNETDEEIEIEVCSEDQDRAKRIVSTHPRIVRHLMTPKPEDRSGHDWRLVCLCIEEGIIDPQILYQIIFQNPYGKAQAYPETDTYIKDLIGKCLDKTKVENKKTVFSNPEENMTLDEVKSTFSQWLQLEDYTVIDTIIGCVVGNSLEGDPVNLYIVAPPSSGKTEILRSLNGFYKVYYLSSLTAQTLISGSKTRDGKFKNSLLLNLKDQGKEILVLKDFTTVLQMRDETRQEILAQLREIADGYYRKTFGTGEEVSWSGKLAIIAGVTPVIERHHSIHQVLGERFLYYRITQKDPRAMAKRAQKFAGREEGMRQQLRDTMTQFLERFNEHKIEEISIPDEINEKLFNLSCFVAQARTGVSRDRYTQAIDYLPEAEGPARLVKQLFTLGCGVTIVQGKKEFDEDVYDILKKIGRDSLPSHRNLILQKMWDREIMGDSWEKTRSLSGYLNSPVRTVKLQLEDLMVLSLVDRKIEGVVAENEDGYHERQDATTPYYWRLSSKCCDFIQTSGIYTTEDDSWDFDSGEQEGIDKQTPDGV